MDHTHAAIRRQLSIGALLLWALLMGLAVSADMFLSPTETSTEAAP